AALGVPGGLAAGSARRATARLGETTLRVETRLEGREYEFLSAIRTGQVLVVVHESQTPLGSRREPVGFSRVSRERSPSLRRATGLATDPSVAFTAVRYALPPRLPIPDFRGVASLRW